MFKKITVLIIAVLFSVTGVFAATVNNKVAVLYNGRSQINRNALHFMGSQFQQSASQYQFKAFDNPSDIKPGDFRAILVLNTGFARGIDPVLSRFIDSWQNKSDIVLISLIKGSSDLSVETVPIENNPQGVDAVSAASIWKKSFLSSAAGQYSNPRTMHEQWINEVLSFINSKN